MKIKNKKRRIEKKTRTGGTSGIIRTRTRARKNENKYSNNNQNNNKKKKEELEEAKILHTYLVHDVERE